MKNIVMLLLICLLFSISTDAASTCFTYQGRLTQAGTAPTGVYDFQFELYDAAVTGNKIGTTIYTTGIPVTKGLFTVNLDFGANAFNGDDRFLAIAVRATGAGDYVVLNPRQPLTATPYSLFARGVNWADIKGRPNTTYNSSNGISLFDNTFYIDTNAINSDMIEYLNWNKIVFAPTSFPPNGDAGGDLTGTFPYPTIGAGKIDSTKLANLSVSTIKIADGAVIGSKITDGSITNTKLSDGSVSTTKIVDTAVITAKLADNAVTTVKITDANVTAAKLADASITAAKLATSAVGNSALASDAASLSKVTGGKMTVSGNNIGFGTTTPGFPVSIQTGLAGNILSLAEYNSLHFGFGISGGVLQTFTQDSTCDIAFGTGGKTTTFSEAMRIKGTGNVGIGINSPATKLDINGTAKMTGFQLGTSATAGHVLTANASGVGTWGALPTTLPPSGAAGGDLTGTYPNPTVGAGKIDSTKLADNAVATAKIAANAVTTVKIADANVTTAKIADSNVTTVKIADSNITTAKIAANAVTTDKITDANITTSKIADNVVTNAKLASDTTSLSKVSGGVMISTGTAIGINTNTVASNYIFDATGNVKMGSLQSVSVDPSAAVDQATTTGTATISWAAIGQSFTCGQTGYLAKIAVSGWTFANTTLSIYLGEGYGGQKIWSQPAFAINGTLVPIAITRPFPVTAGQKYTFCLDSPYVGWTLNKSAGAYSGGMMFTGSGTSFVNDDLAFQTYVQTVAPPDPRALVTNGGSVGINTISPEAGLALDVNGTAKMTGFQLGTSSITGQVLTANTTGSGTWQTLPAYPTTLPPSGTSGGDLSGTYPNPTISSGAVTTVKIADANITTAKLADNAVTSAKIIDGTITGSDIASATITGTKIALNTIDSGRLMNGSVSTNNLADACVSTAKIIDNSVTNTKLSSDIASFSKVTGGLGTASATAITIDQQESTVGLPAFNVAGDIRFTSVTSNVGSLSIDAQSVLAVSTITGSALGQSFTIVNAGYMGRINLRTSAAFTNARLNIYNGTGVGGTLLYTHPGISMTAAGNMAIDFDYPVQVTAGQVLTFQITGPSMTLYLANAYTGGQFYNNTTADTTKDLFFVVGVSSSAPVYSESVTLTSRNGNVGIGIEDPLYKLHVNGSVAGTSAYVNLSDGRLKKNVNTINSSLDKISKLRGVTFDWDKTACKNINVDNNNHLGFIAQEVQKVLPQAVVTDSNGQLSVAYSDVIPVLVEAIKEQQMQVTKSTDQLNKMQAENALLRERLAKIEARLDALETK